MRPLEAVIFDCDGVLVDSEVIAVRVELACLAEIGLHYDPHDFAERFLGQTHTAFHVELEQDHHKQFGRPLPTGFPQAMSDKVWAEMSVDVVAVDGVTETVKALSGAKAVASSSGLAHLQHKLRHVGLFDAFAPHIYSGEGVARGKPFPDIYLHAAAQLGIDPARCLAVEDSVNGVKSAVAAGMTAVGFIGGGHCSPNLAARLKDAGASQVISSMLDVLSIFGDPIGRVS